MGLRHLPIDLRSATFVLATDASFAIAKVLNIQLGYIVMRIDDGGKSIIMQYDSNCFKRVTRPARADKFHGMVLGLDYALVVLETLQEILGRRI